MRKPVPVSSPIAVALPSYGIWFAESIHDPAFEMAWRRDHFHKLIYVLQGSAVREQGDRAGSATLSPGSLTLIPANVEHRLRDERPSILLLLCVAPLFVSSRAEMSDVWARLMQRRNPVFRLGDWWRHRLENIWRPALLEQIEQRPGRAALLQSMATQLLVQLARLPASADDGSVEKRLEAVIREMENTFFDEWTLDRAAAGANMSRRSFSSYFHRVTGRTFLEFLTELRLKHAAQLLSQGHHSIVGAAMAAGYQDTSHFYRLFRKRYGTTPLAWAQAAR